MIKLNWCKLQENAIIPTKKRDTDAGFDFYAIEDITIKGNSSVKFNTGITWQPELNTNRFLKYVFNKLFNIYCQFQSRSGMAINDSIEVTNAGVLDEEYRGNIYCRLYNNSNKDYQIKKGDRIMQGIVKIIPKCINSKIDKSELKDSTRNNKGLGSSGK